MILKKNKDRCIIKKGDNMRKKERAAEVIEVFEGIYPDVRCTLNYTTPFEMLVATQMSAQCTDARVNIVTEKLFKKYKTIEDFASADYEELCRDIKSTGFYRNKAKNIILSARKLLDDFGGEVPDTMEELLTLSGTGRKTANLVLGDIFGKPAVVVDTHCIRLSNRIGLVNDENPVKIEQELKKILPSDKQLKFCHQLVNHGRLVCNARNPKCDSCEINHLCKYYEKEKK